MRYMRNNKNNKREVTMLLIYKYKLYIHHREMCSFSTALE